MFRTWIYWGNTPMTLLRALSIASAALHSPDGLTLVLRRGKSPKNPKWEEGQEAGIYDGHDWLADLLEWVGVKVMWLEDDFPEVAAVRAPDVQTSDLLTYDIMRRFGGTVCDADIMFAKTIEPLESGAIAGVVQFSGLPKADYTPISYVQGRCAPLWEDLWRRALSTYTPKEYECCGAKILAGALADPGCVKLPERVVFPFAGCDFERVGELMFKRPSNGGLPKDSIGVHWYAGANLGHHMNFEVDGNSLISVLGRRVAHALHSR